MDSIKGAQELSRLLSDRHGSVPPVTPPEPLEDPSAAPLFHWLGVEPARGAGAPDGPARRFRLRRRRAT